MTSGLDTTQAQLRVVEAEQRFLEARNEKHRAGRAAGIRLDAEVDLSELVLPLSPVDDVSAAIQDALNSRPDWKAQQY